MEVSFPFPTKAINRTNQCEFNLFSLTLLATLNHFQWNVVQRNKCESLKLSPLLSLSNATHFAYSSLLSEIFAELPQTQWALNYFRLETPNILMLCGRLPPRELRSINETVQNHVNSHQDKKNL